MIASERRVSLVVSAGHAAKLALNISMDTARFAETESDVQKRAALRGLCMLRDEIDQLERHLTGEPERVPVAPVRAA